ncbi:uncharacterized protein LOC143009325 [Genypterus blacodes]|uniref:uncharacterized protein LOC143009325 n=1 Tax=Genypterus blacodes TaxID=154954 RepID=UPI003F76178F
MDRFPVQLKGDVIYLLCVVGGLLMSVAAGGQCVDVAVSSAQHPANLRRLSNALVGLLRCQTRVAKSMGKGKLKRLYINESLLHMLGTLWRLCDFQGLHAVPSSPEEQTHQSATCVSAKRRRFCYVLLGGPVLTLCLGDKGGELKSHSPKNRLQWLADFGAEARTRGDCLLLLVAPRSAPISTGSAESSPQIISDSDDRYERRPAVLTLGLCALTVVVCVMFLPYVVVWTVICAGWKLQQQLMT